MERPDLLVLVRHAESLRNSVKRGATYFADDEMRRTVRGTPDHEIPITDTGMRQAFETGKALRNRFGLFDYIYDSGYLRTVQTRELLLSAYSEQEREKMKVRSNLFIRERDPGFAYDMTEEEADRAFPYLREYWKTFGGFFACPPGGESLAQVTERVYQFLNMLFRDRVGERILVVTHGGTLRSFRFLLERWDYGKALKWPPGESPKNCGITTYNYSSEEKRLVLQDYNVISY